MFTQSDALERAAYEARIEPPCRGRRGRSGDDRRERRGERRRRGAQQCDFGADAGLTERSGLPVADCMRVPH